MRTTSKLLIISALISIYGCGSDGTQGPAGESVKGARGLQGESIKGDPGESITGPKGDRGEKGDPGKSITGPKGETGDQGESAEDTINATLTAVAPYHSSVLDISCDSGRGTGVLVPGNLILTAHHVVKDATSCDYWSGNYLVASGGTFTQLGSRDQVSIAPNPATWTTFSAQLTPVPFMTDFIPTLGERLLLMSFPLDLDADLQYTFGRVNNVDVDKYAPYWSESFTTDMAAAAGSSGGPVFDAAGRLVGLHVGGYNDGGLELNYTLPIR